MPAMTGSVKRKWAKGRPNTRRYVKSAMVVEGRPLKLSEQSQWKHIKNSVDHERHTTQIQARTPHLKASRLKGDLRFAQELIEKYAGTGRKVYKGGLLMEENIKTNKVIGRVWDFNKKAWIKTKWARIKYSSKGAHIFPIYPEPGGSHGP
jgi:hypothetical protein